MRTRTRAMLFGAGLVTVVVIAAVATEVWRSDTDDGCAPVAGDGLVALRDDKGRQAAENIIPVVAEKASGPEMLAALDVASAAIDTDDLVALNRVVEVDRLTPQRAAADLAAAHRLTTKVTTGPGGRVVVGTSELNESQAMGHLYAIALNAAGFTAEVRKIGDSEQTALALERGAIHVAPEYVGRFTEVLNAKLHGANSQPLASSDLAETLHNLRQLGENFGLVFAKPAQAANQRMFAVTKEFATQYGVTTLSELGRECSGATTVLGGPVDCPQQSFCLPWLDNDYGASFGSFTPLDMGGALTKEALRTGRISVGLVHATDPELAGA